MKKAIFLVMLLLLVSSAAAFPFMGNKDENNLKYYTKLQERVSAEGPAYQETIKALGWDEACVKIGDEKYTVFTDYSVSYGCDFFTDASIAIAPSVLDMTDINELRQAYHDGLIDPSFKTMAKAVYVCGVKRACVVLPS